MKHIFVINPAAGQGKALGFIKPKIEEVCKKYSLDYEIYVTEKKGDGIEFVENRAKSGEELRFYACGGDGTLYEIVNGAYGYKNVQVAVIPLGSGNDFIRLFGTKEEFLVLDDQINGVPVELDVIKCGNEIAINQCSMGMDAEVCAMQGKIKKVPLVTGEGAYYIGCICALLTKFHNRFTVTVDDNEPFTQDCLFCVGGNSRWYGGGFMAGPEARPNDGWMDVFIVRKVSRRVIAKLLMLYKNGQHFQNGQLTEAAKPYFIYRRAKSVSLRAADGRGPIIATVDGECAPCKQVSVQVQPLAGRVLLPQPAYQRFTAKKAGVR